MTKEELREHCEKQVKMCEEWAKGNDREPSGKIYEEHKLILDLIKALEQEAYYKNLAQSYEKTINKLTKAIAEQQPSEDKVSLEVYKQVMSERDIAIEQLKELGYDFGEKIRTSEVIPKGATNGDMIKAMFPNIEADLIETNTGGYIEVKYLDTTDECDATAFRKDWWNAPYERDDEE